MTTPERPTVLLVEDNHANILLARAVLEGVGYRVLAVTSGAEFRALLTLETPSVILMDLELPDVNGLDLIAELKGDPLRAEIPVLAVSAHVMVEHQRRAIAAGCAGFLAKPIDIHDLESVVAANLGAGARTI